MTPPKRWPTDAEWAREDALTNLREIKRIVRAMAQDPAMTRTELYRLLSQIADECSSAIETLLKVGPGKEPARPEE